MNWPWVPGVAVLVVFLYVGAFAWSMEHKSFDMWGALIVFPLLLTLSIPIISRLTRDDEPWVERLIILAVVVKLAATFARYWMSFVLYGGTADAATYDQVGRQLATQFRTGDLTPDIHRKVIGTGFLMILTAVVYTFFGQSLLGGYLVFSWIGFWGLYLTWRAFTIAIPDGDARRYGKLVFFLPSLLFWPSGIGKEPWMMLGLGFMAYGTALLLTHRRGAYMMLFLGGLATTMVRPHITVLVLCGLCVAYLLRQKPQQVSALGPLRTILGAIVLGIACVVALKEVSSFFGTNGVSATSANQVLNYTQTQTAQGGSASGVAPDPGDTASISPTHLPMSLVTVLFRPFPFEAHNMQALLASLEGVFLMVALVMAFPRLKHLPKLMLRRPYVAFVVVYLMVFALAFANIKNFGILTRERVQVFQFAVVLLALPRPDPVPVPAGQESRQARLFGRLGNHRTAVAFDAPAPRRGDLPPWR